MFFTYPINKFAKNYKRPKRKEFFNIQGLPSLNVGILPSCRGSQIKKNNVKIFWKFAIFFA